MKVVYSCSVVRLFLEDRTRTKRVFLGVVRKDGILCSKIFVAQVLNRMIFLSP